MNQPGTRRSLWLLGALLAAVVLIVHARSYLPVFCDDAFISLRYAQRLLEGRGLTWNDGERVDGYSNLLWILSTALLGSLRVDLVVAARFLGWIGTGAAIVAVCYRYRPSLQRGFLPAFVGSLTIALSGAIAAWTIGGLEQPMLAGLLAWTIALLPRTEA